MPGAASRTPLVFPDNEQQHPAEAWFAAHADVAGAEAHRLRRQDAAAQNFLT